MNLIKTGKYDSVFTATEKHWAPKWTKDIKPIDWDIYNRPRRQDFNGILVENGAIYISRVDKILNSKCRLSGKIEIFVNCYFKHRFTANWSIVIS